MIKRTAPETYTATIGGVEWSNITPASYMWAEVQERIASGEEVIDAIQPTRISVEQWRETASLDRRGFCIWLLRTGVLTANESVSAARGEWPQAFSDALAGLPDEVQAEAQIEWATAMNIRRNHPLLETVRQRAGIPSEILDKAFGYV